MNFELKLSEDEVNFILKVLQDLNRQVAALTNKIKTQGDEQFNKTKAE